jgi:tetratricopeptide (TPR) repeat protein
MYTEMIALAPDSFRGYSNLGGMYLFQGRYRDAIPQFRRSVSIYPSDDAYSNLGVAYFLEGSYADAAATYEKALQVGANDTTAYIVWGNLAEAYYWVPDQRQKALRLYEKAITLAHEPLRVNPNDAVALEHLALYHAMLRRSDAALAHLRRALLAAPNDPEVLFNSGKVNAQLGNNEQAVQFLQNAVKAGYSVFFVRDDPIFRTMANNVQFEKLVGK